MASIDDPTRTDTTKGAPSLALVGMGHAYERELRGVLSGDDTVIDKMTRTGSNDVVLAYRQPRYSPFAVVRAAGSLGTGDIVAMRKGFAFLLEVKSSERDTVHFSESSGALHEQAVELTQTATRAGVLALYAFRLKGHRKKDPWRLFALPWENLSRKMELLAKRLPILPKTDDDVFVLRWAQGQPLHKFLEHFYWVFEDGLEDPVPA